MTDKATYTTTMPPATRTLLDALTEALRAAGSYNRQDQAPPAAVLWPDAERQWEPLLPRLRERLPIFALGAYAPDQQTGPAYWLRCIIAGTILSPALEDGGVPILYLPGFSRQDVRAVETCARELQPLAELQYRGVIWSQRNGRDWTLSAFLQSKDGGLGIEVAADTATRDALPRSLDRLADELIATLRDEAPIRSAYLNGLLHPDEVKSVLRWLNDPTDFRAGCDTGAWSAFQGLCQGRYGFHPEKDGPITAARLLGEREGSWGTVWRRFAEAPASYPAVPDLLRQARPKNLLPLFTVAGSWPQDNEAEEASARQALCDLVSQNAQAARATVAALEQGHAQRRGWVWASLGHAPLAKALQHLARLATETVHALPAAKIADVAAAYADRGWRADLAALDALAAVESDDDLAAVRAALQTIYRPWLEQCAQVFQQAVASGGETYTASAPPAVPVGTCVLFSDGLRYDVAQRLLTAVKQRGLNATCVAGLAALPTVTVTAKPAISPAASAFAGGSHTGLEPVLAATGTTRVNIGVLRKALGDLDIQVLQGGDLGDPTGRAWTEAGDIDSYGHGSQGRVAQHLDGEVRGLERRIAALIGHGWQRVIVVTDHGWLLMPGGLPKADLPEHLTELRKGRCARLKDGSQTSEMVVPWRWDPAVRIAMAPGIHCYEAGAEYEHGGLSPQECVVPILTVTSASAPASPVAIESIKWTSLRCNVTVQGARLGLRVDLRSKAGDPGSSLVKGGKDLPESGSVAFFVTDDSFEGTGAFVVVVGPDDVPLAQTMTKVGE